MSLSDSPLSAFGFTPVKLLGEGAFGQVFHCITEDGRDLAVKVSTSDNACIAAEREAALMRALPAHPNVMPVTFFEANEDFTVMAMPLATGGDTLKYMQERACSPLSESEVRTLFTQLVDAVDHMHSNGFVHRDIKCENILLTGMRRRQVILADFGFASHYIKGQKGLKEAYGSLHYSSPEICKEVAYEGPEVDIWSMGVVLYAWASGRLPFGGATNEEIAARIVSGNFSMQPRFSPELCDLISKMLKVDRSQRATIADIRKSAWFSQDARPMMPASTSNINLPRLLVEENVNQRRRNSDADIKKPSRFSLAIKGIFAHHK